MSERENTETAEEWRAVVGYDGFYEVSTLGRVRSLKRKARIVARGTEGFRTVHAKILTGSIAPNGYVRIGLSKGRRKLEYFSIHRLVLEAFVGPCPEGMECRHSPDRSKTNNRLSNLKWGTKLENMSDRDKDGGTSRGEGRPLAKLTDAAVVSIRKLSDEGHSRGSVAKMYGVSKHLIRLVAQRKIWRHV